MHYLIHCIWLHIVSHDVDLKVPIYGRHCFTSCLPWSACTTLSSRSSETRVSLAWDISYLVLDSSLLCHGLCGGTRLQASIYFGLVDRIGIVHALDVLITSAYSTTLHITIFLESVKPNTGNVIMTRGTGNDTTDCFQLRCSSLNGSCRW